jgi:osmotically-inducible protein OsmY
MRRILFLMLLFTLSLPVALGQSDQELQVAAQKAVRAYSLNGIQSSAQNGTVSLTGSVDLCRDRLLAVETVKRIYGVKAIRDQIEVTGPWIPDAQLKAQINQIIKDRIHKLGGFGYGSMKANVKEGVVTLSGAAAPELAAPAINAITGTLGVRNMIDKVVRVSHYDFTPFGIHGMPRMNTEDPQ